ncbi:MAG: hypothetical protein ACRD38_03340, partial [Nitrososphaerales archaeon]
MIDPMFVIILLLSPWFMGQVENVIDNNETEVLEEAEDVGAEEVGVEEAELVPTEVEYEPYKPIEQMIKIGITAFSVLLLGL